jgi:hypothetical protein
MLKASLAAKEIGQRKLIRCFWRCLMATGNKVRALRLRRDRH